MVELADNEPLLECWLALGVEVSTAYAVYWTYWDPLELAEFHVPIVDAIRAGDAARAGAEARKHVRRTEQVVRRRTRARARRGRRPLADAAEVLDRAADAFGERRRLQRAEEALEQRRLERLGERERRRRAT